MNRATYHLYKSESGSTVFSLNGAWTQQTLSNASDIERHLSSLSECDIQIDFSDCESIDSAGSIEILRLKELLLSRGCTVALSGIHPSHARLLQLYTIHFCFKSPPKASVINPLSHTVQWFVEYFTALASFLSFIGEMCFNALKMTMMPWKFRWTAMVRHIHVSAIQALPIVMILSFLIGLVVAYQSSGYLTKVGGDVFIVDLSVMSVFRELSPMITAILMAARSASSFTAEIGTMKITEEIDAMKTMGFNPIVFLVLPRVLALVLAMPLLIFAADIAGTAGAMIVSVFHLGMSPHEFIDRLYEEISVNELYVGLGKSPVYGAVVAIVGCYRGFQVQGSTESIGAYTTKSAVSAIFWVIICDAFIAVALTKLGI